MKKDPGKDLIYSVFIAKLILYRAPSSTINLNDMNFDSMEFLNYSSMSFNACLSNQTFLVIESYSDILN